jgi:aspartate aminotransferase
MPLSRKIEIDIQSGSKIRKLFEEGSQLKEIHGQRNVADLSLGNPVLEPPEEFVDIVSRLIQERNGMHRYMPNLGFGWVKDSVAEALREQGYFENVGGRHVMMCAGAAAGMNVVLKTILNPGENAIVVAPYFVEYKAYVENHGGELVVVTPGKDFSIDVNKIEAAITSHTRAIIVNSPNNPTGVVYSRENLVELADMLARKQRHDGQIIHVISDEPYREIVFDGKPFTSIAALYPESFMVYSFSKSLSIPGERIGYVACHPRMEGGEAIMNGMAICNRVLGFVNAPALMQRAIGNLKFRVDVGVYQAHRDKIRKVLRDNAYEFAKPQGTFYFFVKCPGREEDFIERARERFLLVVPGSAFGYPGWFRMAYCVDDQTIELACEKLRELAKVFKV